jgi:hypothetical protein
MIRWPAIAVVALLLLAGTGCARSSFTMEDYALAYQRFADCMSRAGTPLIEHDLTGPVYDYSVPIAAVYLGTVDVCYGRFRFADETWRAAHPDSLAD